MKTLILISGKARSGKNTFANLLEEQFKNNLQPVTQDSFASSVKNGSKEDFKPLIDYINSHVDRIIASIGSVYSYNKFTNSDLFANIISMLNDFKTTDENWFEEKNMITRTLLQVYGTQIFRNRIDTDWWAKQLKERFVKSTNEITMVTDCRFPNEIEVFNNPEDYRVITIRVERNVNNNSAVAAHDSETALDDWTSWNYIIDNNSTLEQLKKSAAVVVNNINKIEL